jgi:hypothetical protein
MMSAPLPPDPAMKLPMLFMSFFENEPDKEASGASEVSEVLEASEVSEAKVEPEVERCLEPETQPDSVKEVKREPDALLDGIDTLGEFVLALDAQLRAERNRSVGLRIRLSRELAALRKALQ